jgi:DNA-binding NtrC family response regulator
VVVPLGGTRPQPIDLGVCAATLRNLREEVGEGRFHEDLYYRIGRPEVYLPPLRERLEEIPQLLCLIVLAAAGRAPGPMLVEACLLRPWPGNVRELCAEARAAATLAAAEGSDAVQLKHLAESAGQYIEKAIRAPGSQLQIDAPRGADSARDPSLSETIIRAASEALSLSQKTLLKLLTPDALLSLLAQLLARDFNQSELAEALGTSRTTLNKLMEDLRLPRASELGAEEIERARARSGDDLEAAARLLRVSPHTLKKYIAALNLR